MRFPVDSYTIGTTFNKQNYINFLPSPTRSNHVSEKPLTNSTLTRLPYFSNIFFLLELLTKIVPLSNSLLNIQHALWHRVKVKVDP